jgi:hypothetical protein
MDGIAGYNIGGAMGWFSLLPSLHPQMDLCDITALACPRAFLAISGWKDILMQPSGAAKAHLKLRKVWDKAGHAPQLGSLFFDSGHEYNRAMQETAFQWFEQHLRPEER